MRYIHLSVGLFLFGCSVLITQDAAILNAIDGVASPPAGLVAVPVVSPQGVVNAVSFEAQIASSTWLTVFGTDLADSTRMWRDTDLLQGKLSTSLYCLTLLLNSKPGYLSYISPTQINGLLPEDDAERLVPLPVSTPHGASQPISVVKQRLTPALFTFDAEGHKYVAAIHADSARVGENDLCPAGNTLPAQPGEVVMLFGNGFGVTDPLHPTSDPVVDPSSISVPVAIQVGNSPASLRYAGLVLPGVYQFNITVPEVPDGDHAVEVEAAGFRGTGRPLLFLQRGVASPASRPIIIDHTTTDLARIPDSWIERVKQNLKVYYGHTSHGAQITNGLLRLRSQYGSKYDLAITNSLPNQPGALNIFDLSAYDWTPDFYPTIARTLSSNPRINVVMYMWCGQHATLNWRPILDGYLTDMQSLEQKYPDITFVYATGNAQERDCAGCVREQFNRQLRAFVKNNNKVLFDFGDLDAWSNGGQYTYAAPNWCSNFGCSAGKTLPAEHPDWGGGDYNNACGHATYPSCDNKAKAMWWLLARITGWDGITSMVP